MQSKDYVLEIGRKSRINFCNWYYNKSNENIINKNKAKQSLFKEVYRPEENNGEELVRIEFRLNGSQRNTSLLVHFMEVLLEGASLKDEKPLMQKLLDHFSYKNKVLLVDEGNNRARWKIHPKWLNFITVSTHTRKRQVPYKKAPAYSRETIKRAVSVLASAILEKNGDINREELLKSFYKDLIKSLSKHKDKKRALKQAQIFVNGLLKKQEMSKNETD